MAQRHDKCPSACAWGQTYVTLWISCDIIWWFMCDVIIYNLDEHVHKMLWGKCVQLPKNNGFVNTGLWRRAYKSTWVVQGSNWGNLFKLKKQRSCSFFWFPVQEERGFFFFVFIGDVTENFFPENFCGIFFPKNFFQKYFSENFFSEVFFQKFLSRNIFFSENFWRKILTLKNF